MIRDETIAEGQAGDLRKSLVRLRSKKNKNTFDPSAVVGLVIFQVPQ